MVTSLEKYFRKLSSKQRQQIDKKLLQIEKFGIAGTDVVPLKNKVQDNLRELFFKIFKIIA